MPATLRSVSTPPGPAPPTYETQERPKRTASTCRLASLDTLACHVAPPRGKLTVIQPAPSAPSDAAPTGSRVARASRASLALVLADVPAAAGAGKLVEECASEGAWGWSRGGAQTASNNSSHTSLPPVSSGPGGSAVPVAAGARWRSPAGGVLEAAAWPTTPTACLVAASSRNPPAHKTCLPCGMRQPST